MSRGVNKVFLIGRLGQDPEIRKVSNGSMTNFTLATNNEWKDRTTGEKKENTEWHRVVMFGKLADIAAQYLKKGSQIYIEGKLQTRKWQGSDGQERFTTEVLANQMQMLDSASGAPQESQDDPFKPTGKVHYDIPWDDEPF